MSASRKTVVILILAATALFVVGIVLERNSDEHHGESVAFAAETAEEQAAESEEGSAQESSTESGDESGEKVLGINLESTPLVVLAVIASLALAAFVWFGRARTIFLLVASAMLGFAIFDIAEVFHQIDRDEAGIALIAGLVAVLHLAAGLVSARLGGEPTRTA